MGELLPLPGLEGDPEERVGRTRARRVGGHQAAAVGAPREVRRRQVGALPNQDLGDRAFRAA